MAGVSVSTVSLAFNSPHRLKQETLEKVRLAARTAGYVGDPVARTLAGGGSRLIGTVVALNLVYVFGPDEIHFWINTSLDRTTQTIEELCLLVITVAGVLGALQLARLRPRRRGGHRRELEPAQSG